MTIRLHPDARKLVDPAGPAILLPHAYAVVANVVIRPDGTAVLVHDAMDYEVRVERRGDELRWRIVAIPRLHTASEALLHLSGLHAENPVGQHYVWVRGDDGYAMQSARLSVDGVRTLVPAVFEHLAPNRYVTIEACDD